MKLLILTIIAFIVFLSSCKKDDNPTNQSSSDTLTVAFYHCDEDSGSILADASGRNNNAYFNGTRSNNGKVGKCITFNGSSQSVSVPSLLPLEFKAGQSFTIEAWVKTSNPGTIFRKDFQCGGSPFKPGIVILRLYPAGSLNAYLHTDPDATVDLRGNKLVADGEWHYVAMVVDASTREVKLYVDNQLDVKASYSGNTLESTAPTYIGAYCGSSAFFQGLMDEIKISMTARY